MRVLTMDDIMSKVRMCLHNKDFMDRVYGRGGLYEWEIGNSVAVIMKADAECYVTRSAIERDEICGIPVRINFQCPEMVRLWRKV